MRNGMLWLTVLAMGLALCGCQSQDENVNWDPDTNYPDWTYDKPLYTEPAVEPKPYETIANNIEVYFSKSDTFFIRHPNGKQGEIRPRTAVWYSYDSGNTWQKNGYYGLYQAFYTFAAEQDGQYWIRFVGPNMGVAEVPPGQPHEIHVVDTQAPVITLQVDPPPFEEVCVDCDGNEVPSKPDGSCCCGHTKIRRQHIYHVGEKVNVYWTVMDVNLEPKTIELSTCFARFPHNLVWSRFKGKLASSGSLEVVIPPEAASQTGMRFRVIAHDKADNIGLGLSEIMEVQPALPETPEETETVEKGETTEQVQPEMDDLPDPSTIQKPKPRPVPLGVPEPPADLTEPVNIETPASKPAAKAPSTQGAITKPTPILALSETLPTAGKAKPASVVKTKAPKTPEPVAVTPKPVKKAQPAKVAPAPKAAPKQAKKPTRSETSLAAMEREMEKARKASQIAKPAPKATPKKEKESAPVAIRKPPASEASKAAPVKVLAKAPDQSKPSPAWKPVSPTQKTESVAKTTPTVKPSAKPTTMKLGDIPEKIQQGWPAKGMTMHGGVSRLLNWLPASAANYQTVKLQFTSNNQKSWITVANDLRPQRVATWTVPMVTSKTCLLRVAASDDQGVQKILETSEPFSVDAGKWETIDMSGFKMQVPKSK